MFPIDLMPVIECDSYLEFTRVRQWPITAGAFSRLRVSSFRF